MARATFRDLGVERAAKLAQALDFFHHRQEIAGKLNTIYMDAALTVEGDPLDIRAARVGIALMGAFEDHGKEPEDFDPIATIASVAVEWYKEHGEDVSIEIGELHDGLNRDDFVHDLVEQFLDETR